MKRWIGLLSGSQQSFKTSVIVCQSYIFCTATSTTDLFATKLVHDEQTERKQNGHFIYIYTTSRHMIIDRGILPYMMTNHVFVCVALSFVC